MSAWLGRHRQGPGLRHFGLNEIQIRHYGDVAIVTARNNALGTYTGHPLPETVRATLFTVSGSDALRLSAIHMSFIAGTQGLPPTTALTDSAEGGADAHADREGR